MHRSIAWISTFALCCASVLATTDSAAAAFPDHPVHLVVGFPPGGGTDAIARLFAQKLSERWGQPVIIDNKVGAESTLAADYVAHAAPDGYTISMFSINNTIISPDARLNYDPIKSFAPISLVASAPNVLVVNADLPVNSLKEFIELARSKPGQLNYGTGGTNDTNSMQMALLKEKTGINMVNITYKSGGPAMLTALLGNEIQAIFNSVITVLGQVKAGKVKALAVTSKTRNALLPDVPSVAEAANIDFDSTLWFGMVATAGTPKDIVTKIHNDIVAISPLPDLQKNLAAQGFSPLTSTPEEFAKFFASEYARWSAVIKTLNTK